MESGGSALSLSEETGVTVSQELKARVHAVTEPWPCLVLLLTLLSILLFLSPSPVSYIFHICLHLLGSHHNASVSFCSPVFHLSFFGLPLKLPAKQTLN